MNKIIYQDFADIAILLVAFQEAFKKLKPDAACLASFNEVLRASQTGLDHCKAAEASDFGWIAIGMLRSKFASADPNFTKSMQEIEAALDKKAKKLERNRQSKHKSVCLEAVCLTVRVF